MLKKNQIAIIKSLLDYPDRQWTLSELSKESKIPKTTTWRIVNELGEQEITKAYLKGNTKIIEVVNKKIIEEILKAVSTGYRKMEKVAKKYAKELYKLDFVEKCILFGSVARGTADLQSDVDVLVLVNNLTKKREEKINLITEKFSSDFSVTIMPDIMDVGTFEDMKKNKTSFATTIKEEGKHL